MTTIDIYGNGNRLSDGSLKSNNPALTAALDEAYKSWKGSEIMAQGTRDNGYYGRSMPTGQYRISEQDAIKQAFEKAGMDPKLIPERADLAASSSATFIFNNTQAKIASIIESKDLDGPAKVAAINLYQANAKAGLDMVGSIAGDVDLGKFMDGLF